MIANVDCLSDPYDYSSNACTDMYDAKYAPFITAAVAVSGTPPAISFSPTDTYCASSTQPCFKAGYGTTNSRFGLWNLPSYASNEVTRINDQFIYANGLRPQVDEARVLFGTASDSILVKADLTATGTETDTSGVTRSGFANMNNNQFVPPDVPVFLRQIQHLPTTCAAGLTPSPTATSGAFNDFYGAKNVWRVPLHGNVIAVVGASTGSHPCQSSSPEGYAGAFALYLLLSSPWRTFG
jgi:hypothetical protein